MENENITILQPEGEVNSATVCTEGKELSVCNTENDETVTVYETDDCSLAETEIEQEAVETPAESKKELIARKCREAKEACQSTANRLVEDWKETSGNPYIKQTLITQVDIYRSPEDETPIDTFRTEQVKGYSARSLAILGAAAVVVACTVDHIMKKILK